MGEGPTKDRHPISKFSTPNRVLDLEFVICGGYLVGTIIESEMLELDMCCGLTSSSRLLLSFLNLLCSGNDDAIPPSPELLWESGMCDVVVDLQDLEWYFGRW